MLVSAPHLTCLLPPLVIAQVFSSTVAGLTLVSAPHLARSYHHLFPPDPFRELLTSDIMTDSVVWVVAGEAGVSCHAFNVTENYGILMLHLFFCLSFMHALCHADSYILLTKLLFNISDLYQYHTVNSVADYAHECITILWSAACVTNFLWYFSHHVPVKNTCPQRSGQAQPKRQ